MRKVLFLAIVLANFVLAQDYMDYASDRANMLAPKQSALQKAATRASKIKYNTHARYEYYTTDKYYTDCSSYYGVNCEDVRYSECYQCRMYTYVVNPTLPMR